MTASPGKKQIHKTPSKPPLRVCHLADIHLGYRRYTRLTKEGFNQREADVNSAFRETVSRVVALKPDITIIAGDLFHSVRPSNAVVAFAFRELRRLAEGTGAPVVVVGGNHETPRRSDTGCVLKLFSEIDGVYIADADKEVFRFPALKLSLTCLPHAVLERLGDIRVRAEDDFPYNILCLHGQIIGTWMSDFGGTEVALSAVSAHEWDYLALGHVHVRTQVGINGAYPGAIEHTSTNIWAESQSPKGFLEIEFPSGRQIFHSLTSPREVIALPQLDALGLAPEEVTARIAERVDEVPGGLDGKIVRLEVVNLSREVYRELDHREIRKIRARALNFSLETRPPVRESRTGGLKRGAHGRLKDDLREFRDQWTSELAAPAEIEQQIEKYLEDVEAQNEAP